MKKLRLGVLGLSEGNGHPYSWSAIFNGFDKSITCPYESIPVYLGAEKYPNNFLSDYAEITHIWTQDIETSKNIASFSKIKNIVSSPEEMIGEVDGVLLARDDAENHFEMAKPFIEKGIPIFIDKPIATDVSTAKNIFDLKTNPNQIIYTCSSLRFGKEFSYRFVNNEYNYVEATIMKDWNKYAIHIIEPVVKMFPNRGDLIDVSILSEEVGIKIVSVKWEFVTAIFKVLGDNKSPIKINLFGKEGVKELLFKDTFYAFKSSLKYFVDLIQVNIDNIPISETLEIVEIIEKGN